MNAALLQILESAAKGHKKGPKRSLRAGNRCGVLLLFQYVRRAIARVRAGDARGGIHIGANRIGCAAGRASRHHVAFDVFRNFSLDHRVRVLLSLLECPLLDRTVYLSHIVDTRVGLRRVAGLDEVGNRNRRQHPDDGHDNHDFHQGEGRPVEFFELHSGSLFGLVRREPGARRL